MLFAWGRPFRSVFFFCKSLSFTEHVPFFEKKLEVTKKLSWRCNCSYNEGKERTHPWRTDGNTVWAFKFSNVPARFEKTHWTFNRSWFYRARSRECQSLSLPRLSYFFLIWSLFCCFFHSNKKNKSSYTTENEIEVCFVRKTIHRKESTSRNTLQSTKTMLHVLLFSN